MDESIAHGFPLPAPDCGLCEEARSTVMRLQHAIRWQPCPDPSMPSPHRSRTDPAPIPHRSQHGSHTDPTPIPHRSHTDPPPIPHRSHTDPSTDALLAPLYPLTHAHTPTQAAPHTPTQAAPRGPLLHIRIAALRRPPPRLICHAAQSGRRVDRGRRGEVSTDCGQWHPFGGPPRGGGGASIQRVLAGAALPGAVR